MSRRAFDRGAARARYCRRLFARRGIVAAAVNPYKREPERIAWDCGFRRAYAESGE